MFVFVFCCFDFFFRGYGRSNRVTGRPPFLVRTAGAGRYVSMYSRALFADGNGLYLVIKKVEKLNGAAAGVRALG